MADGILAAVNENGNIDRFIDTKGGVHYIEPKRYEESVAKIDAAATKAKETVNSATEAVSECKAQTGACTQETARAKEIADTVESRITGIEGDIATLRDSVSRVLARPGITFNGTVTVPGLKNRASVTVVFGHEQHGIMPTTDGTHAVTSAVSGDGWSIFTAYATATVSGEQVTFNNIGFNLYTASGLGSALIFGAGDKETIEAIYG